MLLELKVIVEIHGGFLHLILKGLKVDPMYYISDCPSLKKAKVVIIDDLLATGGTAKASTELVALDKPAFLSSNRF